MPISSGNRRGCMRGKKWDQGEFIASAEVAAFACLLGRKNLPEIAGIIRQIASRCGYRETAERFRPAFEAFRDGRRA